MTPETFWVRAGMGHQIKSKDKHLSHPSGSLFTVCYLADIEQNHFYRNKLNCIMVFRNLSM